VTQAEDHPADLAALLTAAKAAQDQGQLEAAETLVAAVLAQAPAQVEALTLGASLALRRGEAELAAQRAEQACLSSWDSAQPHLLLGLALRLLGRPVQALASFESAIGLRPHWAEPHHALGITLHDLGAPAEAVAALAEAVRLKPEAPLAQFHLGNALADLGRHDEAVSAYQAAVTLDPGFAEAHNNLGNALLDLERYDEAAAAFEAALAVRPDFALAFNNLGNAERHRERLDAAFAAYARAVQLQPDLAEPHHNLGNLLRKKKRYDEAVVAFQTAVRLKPDYAEAYGGLGASLRELWRFDEAIAAYQAGAELSPSLAMPRITFALMLVRSGRVREALAQLDGLIATAEAEDRGDLFRALMFCAANHDDPDPTTGRALAEAFAREFGGQDPVARPIPATPAEAERRLRIGYLSSDLHRHPVAINLLPVLRAHDRERFELYFYALNREEDDFSAEFRSHGKGWRAVHGGTDEDIARQIAADQIDILVLLAGHFDLNRPAVAGWRAAPVQISLHDVGTTGLAEMDYIIGDRWLLPRHSPEYFSERPLRLPQFYVADLPKPRPLLTQPRSGPAVFCCFNSPAKIGPATLALWGRLLAARPETRLILKYMQAYSSTGLRDRISAGLASGGATPDQVIFITQRDSPEGFISRYNEVDLALDPFPFSGSTTSFQALAMGVPVLTWPWPRMVSRWSAAMLHRLGLEELIADSAEDYLARACAIADQVEVWRGRRAAIRAALEASPLCQGKRWARHLERLYRAVWRRHVLGTR